MDKSKPQRTMLTKDRKREQLWPPYQDKKSPNSDTNFTLRKLSQHLKIRKNSSDNQGRSLERLQLQQLKYIQQLCVNFMPDEGGGGNKLTQYVYVQTVP